MNSKIARVLLCAMALTMAACKPEVWLFGDSITGLYCNNFQALHPDWNVTCLGVGGEQTGTGLIRLQSELGSRRPLPHFVVIEEGTNNCVWNSSDACPIEDQDPEWIVQDLMAMVHAVSAANPKIKTFVTSTLYTGLCPIENTEGTCLADGTCPSVRCFFNNACALDAGITINFAEDQVIYFPLDGDDFFDLLHPKEAAQDRMAQIVTDALTPYIPTTSTTTSTTCPTLP